MATVYHGIYTNAYGEDGKGFRSLFPVPSDWPESGKERVEKWLQKLVPQQGQIDAAGVSIDCFRLEEVIYYCLAMVEPDFALDELRRPGGFLAHSLILPLEEGRPQGDFGGALLELRRSFEKPKCDDRDRLDAYLEQCRQNSEVMSRPADLQWILALKEEFWFRFFEVFSIRSNEAWWPADLSSDFPMDFLRVSALVPPRLRLAFRWSFELAAVPENAVRIRLGSRQGLRAPQKTSLSELYWDWLTSCVNQGEPELVYQLAESWTIKSWDDLEREIRAMAKKRAQQKEATPELREQPAEKSAAGLNDLKRIEKSVKSYVDQRLEGLDPSGVSSGSGWYRRWRTEIWGVPIVLWLVLLTLRGGGGAIQEPLASDAAVGDSHATAESTTKDAKQTSSDAKREQTKFSTTSVEKVIGNWSVEWAKYVKEHKADIGSLMKAAVSGEGMPSRIVEPAQKKALDEIAGKLATQGEVSSEDIDSIRRALFEYAFKRWQGKDGRGVVPGKIDSVLNESEYPPEQARAFFEAHRVSGLSERQLANPHENEVVQTLVVITWLERTTS